MVSREPQTVEVGGDCRSLEMVSRSTQTEEAWAPKMPISQPGVSSGGPISPRTHAPEGRAILTFKVRECVGGPALQVVHSVGDDGLAPWVMEEEEDTFNLASGEDLIDLSSETMSGGGSFSFTTH